jgi:putative ABC transport system permease protein
MRRPSLLKSFRDIKKEKSRTTIVAAAVFLGVFAVAMMATSYILLKGNLHTNYTRTNPASMVVVTDRADPSLINRLKLMPEIEDVEVRDSVIARFRTGPDTYVPLLLFSVHNFNNVKINKFTQEKGRLPENERHIAIERTAAKMTQIDVGKEYDVVIPGAGTYRTTLSGTVHDPGLAPSWMEGMLYGYVTGGFGPSIGIQGPAHTLLLTVKNGKTDIGYIRKVTSRVIGAIKEEGRIVYRTEVPRPGRHVHQGQMDSLMFLLVMFGILTLFLSSSLIVNMISAIMAREIRQIGVMKAIGATTARISWIYLTMVLIIAFCATIIATPIGIFAGTKYAEFVASMLNFTLFDRSVGIATVGSIVIVGIALPCLVALFPVIRRASTSVNQALNDYGVTQKSTKAKEARKAQSFLGITFSQTLLLSLRNTLRRKTRFALTLITLVLGGAVFITTFNIRQSMTGTVTDKFDNQKYDLAIALNKPYPDEQIAKAMSSVPAMGESESWHSDKVTRVFENGLESGAVDLRAVKVPSKVFSVEVVAGSWLSPDDRGVVINHALASLQPDLTPGKKVLFKIGGKTKEFTVKGVIREIFVPPAVYMSYGHYAALTGTSGMGRLILADVDNDNRQRFSDTMREIENNLAASGIDVKMVYNKLNYKARVVDHLLVITSMLIMMTILIIVVGGLGVVITMGINIVERKREIGILRAIGATDSLIYRMLGNEGLFLGVVSWLCASVISLPLSYYLGNVFFRIFFETTMEFMISPAGFVAGLAVNLLFGSLAVLIPARTALKMPVAGTLAYE